MLIKSRWIIFCFLLIASCSSRIDNTNHSNVISLKKIEGRYQYSFENWLVGGVSEEGLYTEEKYVATNTLDIIKINDNTAFVKLDIICGNGHVGNISGIAELNNTMLILEGDPAYDEAGPEDKCVVTFDFSKDDIVVDADYKKYPGCSNYHGARCYLGWVNSFSRDSRSKIPNYKELYKIATKSYENKLRGN